MNCTIITPGRMRYEPAYQLQMQCVARIKGDTSDPQAFLILLEHDPVLTMGRRSEQSELLVPRELLAQKGIEVHEIDRGGRITYHGPGQIVGYPIIPLLGDRRDVYRYMRSLEQILIDVLAGYGITAGRVESHTGVWVGNDKIAAIGIGVTRWITFHGFALNVDPDMSAFSLITPCGITGKGVTSMRKLLGRAVSTDEVCGAIITAFQKEFSFDSILHAAAESV